MLHLYKDGRLGDSNRRIYAITAHVGQASGPLSIWRGGVEHGVLKPLSKWRGVGVR